jgi:hypothetical protein
MGHIWVIYCILAFLKANIVVVSLFSRICFVYDLVCIDMKILIGAMGFSFFFFSFQ